METIDKEVVVAWDTQELSAQDIKDVEIQHRIGALSLLLYQIEWRIHNPNEYWPGKKQSLSDLKDRRIAAQSRILELETMFDAIPEDRKKAAVVRSMTWTQEFPNFDLLTIDQIKAL